MGFSSDSSEKEIVNEPKPPESFDFECSLFEDAVVMPSYRNMDQPQYFYVAEIRHDLNPRSPFPSPELYDTFKAYYETKYNLQISNTIQPLLDVDHTSARLNLLTPRYMNQKGVALPTSSAETRRARRENLQQKQILVPELCDVHPFPASLWRKAVCLPAILYRTNCLLICEEIRQWISDEATLGVVMLPDDYRFPQLEFGFNTQPSATKQGNSDDGNDENLVNGESNADEIQENTVIESHENDANEISKNVEACNPASNPDTHSAILKKVNAEHGAYNGSIQHKTNHSLLKLSLNHDADKSDNEDMVTPPSSPESFCSAKETMSPFKKPEKRSQHVPYDNQFCDEMNNEEEMIIVDGKFVNNGDLISTAKTCSQRLSGGACDSYSGENISDNVKTTSQGDATGPNNSTGSNGCVHREDSLNVKASDCDNADVQRTDSTHSSVQNKENEITSDDSKNQTPIVTLPETNDLNLGSNNFTPSVKFDYDVELDKFIGPSPCTILQTITMSNANDFFNLERLETIGDSFLKFSITVYLYCTYPGIHEGKLSYLRSKQVSNYNLYRLGKKKGFPDRMVAAKFEPQENWLPPGYIVKNNNAYQGLNVIIASVKNTRRFRKPSYSERIACEEAVKNQQSPEKTKEGDCSVSVDTGNSVNNAPVSDTKSSAADTGPPGADTMSPSTDTRSPGADAGSPSTDTGSLCAGAGSPSPDTGSPGADTRSSGDGLSEASKFERELQEATKVEEAGKLCEPEEENSKTLIPYNLQTQHSLPDKSIADCMEALIGCYLTTCSQKAALLFMTWLGLKVRYR